MNDICFHSVTAGLTRFVLLQVCSMDVVLNTRITATISSITIADLVDNFWVYSKLSSKRLTLRLALKCKERCNRQDADYYTDHHSTHFHSNNSANCAL